MVNKQIGVGDSKKCWQNLPPTHKSPTEDVVAHNSKTDKHGIVFALLIT